MPSAIVLGAGMAGVAIALHLRDAGWDVTLADRLPPGRATSYGNAGVIQSEAVEPYAMPRDLATLLAVVRGQKTAIRIHWPALAGQAAALARYWWNSAPARHRRLAIAYAGLIGQAAPAHADFLARSNAAGLVRKDGFRIFLRDPRGMEAAVRDAERVHATYGVPFRALTPQELAAAEPGLTHTGAGAIHWLAPWTVRDPGGLVEAYAQAFLRAGGQFQSADASTLEPAGSGWRITTEDGPLEAEHAVVALGPWSPELLRRFGYRIPMVRKRGYHRHYAGTPLDLPLVDEANGYVLAPMAQGLRLTTGAELTHADAPPDLTQLHRAEAAANGLLPLGAPVEETPWSGTRPCMPDMLPVIGKAHRHAGLWLHFGHGHQGFTLGPATGRLLAQQMTGQTPFVDPAPFRADRF
ncbi:NAD(P)/FAD-dependent oxidoreductase [Xanthobacteraceae bacterium A53D]